MNDSRSPHVPGEPAALRCRDDLGGDRVNIGERGDPRLRALAEPLQLRTGRGLRQLGIFGPRLHHQLRLQAADDIAGALSIAALEARDVILMTMGRDHSDEVVAHNRLDVVRDPQHQVLRRPRRERLGAEIDQHMLPLAAVVVEAQQEAVAESDLIGPDVHAFRCGCRHDDHSAFDMRARCSWAKRNPVFCSLSRAPVSHRYFRRAVCRLASSMRLAI